MSRRRSKTLQKKLVKGMRYGDPQAAGIQADLIGKMPVSARDKAKKMALIRELKDIEKQHSALARRMRTAADRLERLSVEPALI